MKKQGTTNNLLMGIICIIISAFCFSLMSLFIRLSGDVPVIQKCFFRNAVAFIIAIAAMVKAKTPIRIGTGNLKYLLIRSIAGTLGMLLNFYAVDHLPISDASILNKLSPFFAIIFSVFVLKEVANRYEWFAVAVAFLGALFVVKPSFNLEVIPAVAGVLGGCGAGLAYTYVRKLGQRGENGMMIVLFFSGFSTFSLLPYLIFHFTPMTLQQWIYLWLTGAAAAGGQVFITKAYAYAPAKEISVYDFSNVVFSAIWGVLFLRQIPDWLSIIGYIIIIGTAVVKWWFSMRKPVGSEIK
jgi:drug/metabolite transporter (DMT)-like permease